MEDKKIIPIRAEVVSDDVALGGCASAEPFALMVLGDSMLPEFEEGEIIIIEPEGLATSGSFVLAYHDDEYIFRQLAQHEERWYLRPLNDLYPTVEVPGLDVVKGVVTQKKRPGRRAGKTYE